MIYRDEQFYPVSQDDGMDSCVRNAILCVTYGPTLTKPNLAQMPAMMFTYCKDGLGVRHPNEFPANNPKNFTRDQHTCLVAGLYAQQDTKELKELFFATLKRGFTTQSTERDVPGSTKLPFPHWNYRDSNPEPTSFPFYKGKPKAHNYSNLEFKYFDGPDLLLPNHIWMMIKASKLYSLYFMALIGIPFFIISLIFHRLSNKQEQNQIYCEAYVNGTWAMKLFDKLCPKWKTYNYEYWTSRNEVEYHDLMVVALGERIGKD